MEAQVDMLLNSAQPYMTFVNEASEPFANRMIRPVLRDCTADQRLMAFVHGRIFKCIVLTSLVSVLATVWGLSSLVSLEALVFAKAVEFAFHFIPTVLVLVECVVRD